MPYSFWEAIAETPWWFVLVIFYFAYVGYLTTRPHTIKLKPYMAAHIGYAIIAGCIFIFITPVNLATIKLLLSAGLLGALSGWLQFRIRRVKLHHNNSQLDVPGSWLMLILLPALVAAKYYYFGNSFNVGYSIEFYKDDHFIAAFTILFGLFIGMFTGRFYYIYRCMRSVHGGLRHKNRA